MSRKERRITKYMAPWKNNSSTKGRMETKSMIPKKLRMYFRGLGEQNTRRAYSIVKKMLNATSNMVRTRMPIPSLIALSNTVMITLNKIIIIRIISKCFPTFVLLLNMML